MYNSPTQLVHKSIARLDPYSPYRPPTGPLYGTARWIRDFPFRHPTLTTMGLIAALPLGGIVYPAAGLALGAAAAYSTARDVAAAAPNMINFLGRLGAGRPEFTAPMVDTQMAMSMRQASLRALHDSGYFLRSVLTHEARLMHR